MKKIALVLAVLLCALPMMAFAEIAVTGSVSFSIGNTSETDPTLPAFSTASSVAGSVSIATDDEKVVASAKFNLLPTVTTTYTAYSNDAFYQLAPNYLLNNTADYTDYMIIDAYVGFWNDHADDETAVAEATIWGTTTEADLETSLKDGTNLDLNASDPEAGELAIIAPVSSAAGTDEFVWTATTAGYVATIQGTFTAALFTEVDTAIEKILAEASANVDFDETTYNLADGGGVDTMKEMLAGVVYDEVKDWTANDKAVVKQALDLELAWDALAADPGGDPTVTSALAFVESASLAFKDVAGVLDITFNLKGTHVAAGAISVDAAGHTDDAVAGYPSLMLGLSSGVVEGLNAGVTMYIDDNGAQDAVSDDWYTWLDEADDMAEPVYGLGVCGGYTMAMDDMTVGAKVTLGLYDLMGGADLAYAVSVAPSFSGMGANVGVQFDYGMDMMYLMAAVDYTIMGITPNVAFYYASATGDNVLAYSGSPASVMSEFKNGTDGMLLAGGLSADLTDLIGMGVSVSAGAEYGIGGAADAALAWNAGLSVGGLVDGLTIGFDCNADSVAGSTFDYAVSASYAYSIATLSASLGSAYNADDEVNYTSWSLGTSVSF